MKALMILSLYMLLAYTWNTDLRIRYKSVEINYGLSEYWHGGLSRNVDKIGRDPRGGKLFNDDNSGGDDGIAKLMNSLEGGGGGGGEDGESASASGDAPFHNINSEDGGGGASSSIIVQSSSRNTIEKKKQRRRPPSLSHARSVADASHPAYGVYRRAQQQPKNNRWTLSKLAWALVWMAFMLPIVEASAREVRRQLNLRFWNVRRLRSFRAVPGNRAVSGGGGGGGRVVNVHNL